MFKPIDRQELAYYEMVSDNPKLTEDFLNILELMLTNERENGGHTGFTIRYVAPTLRKWFKDEVIEGSNTITAKTMNIFNIYKGEYKELLLDIFEALLLYRPLSPLTFNKSEFNEPDLELGGEEETICQNKRCSAVFTDKRNYNRPYFLNAIVFTENNILEDGTTFTNTFTGNATRLGSVNGPRICSSAFIKKHMCYKTQNNNIDNEPQIFYIKTILIDGVNVIVDTKQLKKVKKHYHLKYIY